MISVPTAVSLLFISILRAPANASLMMEPDLASLGLVSAPRDPRTGAARRKAERAFPFCVWVYTYERSKVLVHGCVDINGAEDFVAGQRCLPSTVVVDSNCDQSDGACAFRLGRASMFALAVTLLEETTLELPKR